MRNMCSNITYNCSDLDALPKDTNKFGHRLMEKMGWKPGNGLGINQQGSTDHVKVSVRSDNRGVGFKGRPEDVLPHQNDFSTLLEQLAANVDEPTTSSESSSLEKKSQQSRTRLHYHKSTRGKDLSRYSEKDLACILGKSATQPPEQPQSTEHSDDAAEVDPCSDEQQEKPTKNKKKAPRDEDSSSEEHGEEETDVVTKKTEKHEKRKQAEMEIAESEGALCKKQRKIMTEKVEVETPDSECKKNRKNRETDIDDAVESVDAHCKKQKKKKTESVVEVATELLVVDDCKKKKKKKVKQEEADSVVEGAVDDEADGAADGEADGASSKKKKKRKRLLLEVVTETEGSERKKERKRKLEEESTEEDNGTTRKKEKKKKSSQEATEVDVEVKVEETTDSEGKPRSEGKTKRRKSVTFSDELFHVVIIPPREDEDADDADEEAVKDEAACEEGGDGVVWLDGVKYVNGIREGVQTYRRQLISKAPTRIDTTQHNIDSVYEGFPGANVAEFGYQGLDHKQVNDIGYEYFTAIAP